MSRDENRENGRDMERDIDLGTALLGLDVPDHAEGFFERLETSLATAPSPASDELAARRAKRLTPGRWYTSGGALLAGAAAMVMVVGIGTAVVSGFGDHVDRPSTSARVSTASDVGQLVAASYAQAQTLSGVLVHRVVDEGRMSESSVTFTVSADGDFLTRTSDSGATTVMSYDAKTGRVTTVEQPASGTPVARVQRNVDPASPQARSAASMLQRSIGSVATALLDSDRTASAVTYDGRPAWRVDVPAVVDQIATSAPDSLEVTVDQQTGFPVQVVASEKGRVIYTDVLRDLVVNKPTSGDTFTAQIPAGVTVRETDGGFLRVPLPEAAAHVGYAPLAPADLPIGFELAQVAVAKTGNPSGPEGMNPAGRDVVSLVYRHGFDTLVVQTWRAGTVEWDDPLGMEGYAHSPRDVVLSGGALAGATATVVSAAPATPHLWLVHDGLVVLIAGDASADQLVAVANSVNR